MSKQPKSSITNGLEEEPQQYRIITPKKHKCYIQINPRKYQKFMVKHTKYIHRLESKGNCFKDHLKKVKIVKRVKYNGTYSPLIRSSLVFFKKFIKYYVYKFVGDTWLEQIKCKRQFPCLEQEAIMCFAPEDWKSFLIKQSIEVASVQCMKWLNDFAKRPNETEREMACRFNDFLVKSLSSFKQSLTKMNKLKVMSFHGSFSLTFMKILEQMNLIEGFLPERVAVHLEFLEMNEGISASGIKKMDILRRVESLVFNAKYDCQFQELFNQISFDKLRILRVRDQYFGTYKFESFHNLEFLELNLVNHFGLENLIEMLKEFNIPKKLKKIDLKIPCFKELFDNNNSPNRNSPNREQAAPAANNNNGNCQDNENNNVHELLNNFVKQFQGLDDLRIFNLTCKMNNVVTPITETIIKIISQPPNLETLQLSCHCSQFTMISFKEFWMQCQSTRTLSTLKVDGCSLSFEGMETLHYPGIINLNELAIEAKLINSRGFLHFMKQVKPKQQKGSRLCFCWNDFDALIKIMSNMQKYFSFETVVVKEQATFDLTKIHHYKKRLVEEIGRFIENNTLIEHFKLEMKMFVIQERENMQMLYWLMNSGHVLKRVHVSPVTYFLDGNRYIPKRLTAWN